MKSASCCARSVSSCGSDLGHDAPRSSDSQKPPVRSLRSRRVLASAVLWRAQVWRQSADFSRRNRGFNSRAKSRAGCEARNSFFSGHLVQDGRRYESGESVLHPALYPVARSPAASPHHPDGRNHLPGVLSNRQRPKAGRGQAGRSVCLQTHRSERHYQLVFRRGEHEQVNIDECGRPDQPIAAEREKGNRSADSMSPEPDTLQREPGELLLEGGKITEQQLDAVRRRQRRLNLPQHRAILDLNFASEEDTWRALATANHLEFVDPVALDPNRETLELVALKFIFHYHLLSLGLEDEGLILAFSEPPRQMEQGNLRLLLAKRFKIVLATPSAIHAVIKKHFGLGAETVEKLRQERGGAELDQEIVFDVQDKETDSAIEATVSGFVDQILHEALRLRATDIHLEPYANSIRLRYRVDGILETVPVPADIRQLHAALVSRLKIMT